MQTTASDVQGIAKNQYVLEIQNTIPHVTFYKEIVITLQKQPTKLIPFQLTKIDKTNFLTK